MGKLEKIKFSNVNNDGVLYTRNLILRSVCFVYLCAFLTFYYQSPGLFGKNGILPAHLQIDTTSQGSISAIHKKPTLLHFSSYFGLDTEYMIDLLAILGSSIAFTGFISQKFCLLAIFAALWSLYYSLIQITQAFENQSDLLLLEAGFVCLILAPLNATNKSSVTDKIGIVMIKWLLFRFMFDSGAVKFFSGCPYWWNFSGLARHFETLPLPTPLSWFCHHLPSKFLKISTIFTHISELVCPWFFFFPSRAVRIFLFYWEVYLQFNIIISGNYGFMNLLMIALLFSLLDDKYFQTRSRTRHIIKTAGAMIIFTFAFLILFWIVGNKLDKLAFKYEHLAVLRSMIKLSPLMPLIAVIATFLSNLLSHPSIKFARNSWKKASDINTLFAFTICSLALIGISIVPHNNMDASTNITNTQLGKYYQEVSKYNIVNEYGKHLRRMRPERLEITLEYRTNADEPWVELPFIYKPWSADESTPYAGPYLPRLDIKFYEASTMNYREQPWMLSLAYRILQNEPTVLKLFGIDSKISPPPKYIRGILNRFKYTPLIDRDETPYWIKKVLAEHFPAFSVDSPTLLANLKSLNIANKRLGELKSNFLKNILQAIRQQLELVQGHILILTISIAGFIIIISKK